MTAKTTTVHALERIRKAAEMQGASKRMGAGTYIDYKDVLRLVDYAALLTEALDWYADEANWQNETPGTWVDDEGDAAEQVTPSFLGKVFVEDIGEAAKAALAAAAARLEGE